MNLTFILIELKENSDCVEIRLRLHFNVYVEMLNLNKAVLKVYCK